MWISDVFVCDGVMMEIGLSAGEALVQRIGRRLVR
jgi:hypothetical protein